MQAPTPTPAKPSIFVSGDNSKDSAAILDLGSRYVFAEVFASRGTTAQELAANAIEEYRRETGKYPSSTDRSPADASVTPFGVFLEQYTARVELCEESARILPRQAMQYHSATAAMTAARAGQLLTYLQAVTMLSAMGSKGTEAIDLLNAKLDANNAREAELIQASPPGTTLDGMMRLNVEQAAFHAASTAGITEYPLNPQPIGQAATSSEMPRAAWWALAEKIAPWWAKHSGSFLAANAQQQSPSLFDCPGLSDSERLHAIEALNGLQFLQRSVTAAQGKDIALPDIVGYDQQWKSLFVMSLMSPNTRALTDAANKSAPLALSLRRRFADASSQRATAPVSDKQPVALPETSAAAKGRRTFRL